MNAVTGGQWLENNIVEPPLIVVLVRQTSGIVTGLVKGRKKMKETEWNLNRFCNKSGISVVGGASKLLNFFIKNYSPTRIISYSDKDWSSGNLYEKLGFKKTYETKPDYKYLVDFIRIHKSNFKKSVTGISESKLNLPRVWDCGKIKWEFIL